VIVQEKGLEAAASRIRELEERLRQLEAGNGEPHHGEESGGFLSSIFGSSQPQRPTSPPSSAPAAPSGPWSNASRQNYQPSRGYDPRFDDDYRAPQSSGRWGSQAMPSAGSSFLGGALGTAAGVAGGMLLANSLSGIFGNHMSSLGLGSPFAGNSPFGTEAGNTSSEETVINNYYGEDAIREASGGDAPKDADPNDGLQQADFGNDYAGDAPDFSDDGLGGDDNLDV
jgi:hypothetical protein